MPKLFSSRQERRPRDIRLEHGMPRLICGVSMLKAPYLNLTEQGERRLLAMWIADDQFKQPLSNGVASERRKRVRVPGSSVGTTLEKGILHRSHKLVRNPRAVVAKDAKSLHAIILAGELAEDLCEKHSLGRRYIAIREFDQFTLDGLVFHGAFSQESR